MLKNATCDYVYDEFVAIHYPLTATTTYEYGQPGETAENQVGRVKRIVDDVGEETRGYGKLGETTRSTRTVKPLKPNGGTPDGSGTALARPGIVDAFTVSYRQDERIVFPYARMRNKGPPGRVRSLTPGQRPAGRMPRR